MKLKRLIVAAVISLSPILAWCDDLDNELDFWMDFLSFCGEQFDAVQIDSYEAAIARMNAVNDTINKHNVHGMPSYLPTTTIIQLAADNNDTINAIMNLASLRNKVYDDYCRYLLSPTSFGFMSPFSNSFFSESSAGLPLLKAMALLVSDRFPDDATSQFAYESLLHTKSSGLQAENSLRKFAYDKNDSIAISLFDKLYDAQQKFKEWENQNNKKPFLERQSTWKGLPEYYSEYAGALKDSIESYRGQLLDRYSLNPEYIGSFLPHWRLVQQCLNAGEYAIEFGVFKDTNGETKCIAYVISNDCDAPEIVNIPNSDKLADLKGNTEEDIARISTVIWAPILDKMPDCQVVYFAADGELNSIPIEHSIDKAAYRLSTTRELINSNIRHPQEYTCAVLYGGLYYDENNSDFHEEGAETSKERYGVYYLKNSKKEIAAIDSLLLSNRDIHVDKCSGFKGTEESFRSLYNLHPNIVHISTHGFYWDEDKAKELDYISFLSDDPTRTKMNDEEILIRSGILLSNANQCLEGKTSREQLENDGVLTSYELSRLFLGDIDLVTLSACQTGLGDISTEGVYGLQRGFKLSGARSLFMSLWNVDDEATMVLMTEFYRNLLDGKTKVESLKLAQEHVRNTPGWEHPKYWAAWILLDALN